MSFRKNFPLVVAVISAGFGLFWLAKRQSQEVDGLVTWQKVLARRHGPVRAHQMADQVRQRYRKLLAERPLPGNPTLRRHVVQNILPGLALYQVLLQEHAGDRPAALAEVDENFRLWTLTRYRMLLAPLKVLPVPFWLFRLAFAGRMRAFPAEGWDFEFVEKSGERIAFNATRCFYLNTLKAYGAPESTAAFCKTDEVQAELFPASVRFVRPHTLGRGDALCDFQYCRIRQP